MDKKIYAELSDDCQVIKLDISVLLESMPDKAKQEMVTWLSLDRQLLRQIVDQLTKGQTATNADEVGEFFSSCSLDESFYNELREKLLEKLDCMTFRTVRQLIWERDKANDRARKALEWIEAVSNNRRSVDDRTYFGGDYPSPPTDEEVKREIHHLHPCYPLSLILRAKSVFEENGNKWEAQQLDDLADHIQTIWLDMQAEAAE